MFEPPAPRKPLSPHVSRDAGEEPDTELSEQAVWAATAASVVCGKIYEHRFVAFGKPAEPSWASALLFLVKHGEGHGPDDYDAMPACDRLKARGFEIDLVELHSRCPRRACGEAAKALDAAGRSKAALMSRSRRPPRTSET